MLLLMTCLKPVVILQRWKLARLRQSPTTSSLDLFYFLIKNSQSWSIIKSHSKIKCKRMIVTILLNSYQYHVHSRKKIHGNIEGFFYKISSKMKHAASFSSIRPRIQSLLLWKNFFLSMNFSWQMFIASI